MHADGARDAGHLWLSIAPSAEESWESGIVLLVQRIETRFLVSADPQTVRMVYGTMYRIVYATAVFIVAAVGEWESSSQSTPIALRWRLWQWSMFARFCRKY